MIIGILTTIDHPLAGLLVESLSKVFEIDSIVVDSKTWTAKDQAIWNTRTQGKLESLSLYQLTQSMPIYLVENHNDEKARALIRQRTLDLLINCGTPRILSSSLLHSPTIGVLNCHPGLLPNYRGCSCVEWALRDGNTAHLMTKEIDEGPIVFRKELDISQFGTYEEIRVGIYLDSIEVLTEAIKKLGKHSIQWTDYPRNGKYHPPMGDEQVKLLAKMLAKRKGGSN